MDMVAAAMAALQGMTAAAETLRVVVRCRPRGAAEERPSCVAVDEPRSQVVLQSSGAAEQDRVFTFNAVLGEASSQEQASLPVTWRARSQHAVRLPLRGKLAS